MEALEAKFGPYFSPFVSYVESSGVALEDLDYDTNWDHLLAEVVWPPGCCPNAAQRSAMKKALRAYCQPQSPVAPGRLWTASVPLRKGQPSPAAASKPDFPRADSIQTWPLAGAYARNFSRGAEDAPRRSGCRTVTQKLASHRNEEDDTGAVNQLLTALEGRHCTTAKTSRCSQQVTVAGEAFLAENERQSPPAQCSQVHKAVLVVGGSVEHQTVQAVAERTPQGELDVLLQSALKVTAEPGRILPSSSPGDPLLDQLADALLEQEDRPRPTPTLVFKRPLAKPGAVAARATQADPTTATLAAAAAVGEAVATAAPAEPCSTPAKAPRHKTRRTKAARPPAQVVDPETQRIDRALAEEFAAFKAKLNKPASPTPSKSAPFMPNYKAAPAPRPKKSLHQQNAELLDFCGVDHGTIMQHWMELWKERGRPNRGAELLLFQEATLQFLQQHRQGRKVEDGWALQNVIRTYANAKSELLRNMMADEAAAKVDADGDDALNMDEFRRLYAETHPGQAISDEVIKAAWKFADKDGSGEIDFAEMMLWLDKIAYDETGIYVPEK
eukprot:EG_transcript_6483